MCPTLDHAKRKANTFTQIKIKQMTKNVYIQNRISAERRRIGSGTSLLIEDIDGHTHTHIEKS